MIINVYVVVAVVATILRILFKFNNVATNEGGNIPMEVVPHSKVKM